MRIRIKYMLSERCKMAVKEELRKLGLHFIFVDLGEVEIMETLSPEQREQLKLGLLNSGLALMDDNNAVLIERIKTAIHEMIHDTEELVRINFSAFLSDKLNRPYQYLADLFTEVHGTTIQQFVITQKIEWAKELIVYGRLNISEIANKMNYSSAAHLSNQFKKITGLSPSHFMLLHDNKQSQIEQIIRSNNIQN